MDATAVSAVTLAAGSRKDAESVRPVMIPGATIPRGEVVAPTHRDAVTASSSIATPRVVAVERNPQQVAASAEIPSPWPAAIAVFAALVALAFLLAALLRRRSRRKTHMNAKATPLPDRIPEAPKVETVPASTIWITPASALAPARDEGAPAPAMTVTAAPGAPLLFDGERSSRAYVVDQVPGNLYAPTERSASPRLSVLESSVVAMAPIEPVDMPAAAHPAPASVNATHEHEVAATVAMIDARPSMSDRATAPVTQEQATSTPLGEAPQMLESGNYAGALEQLAGSMADPHAPIGTWILAAHAWWCIAQDSGDAQAYERAAEAMEHMLEREPGRHDVWARMGRCRLLQAESESEQARTRTLDIAIVALRRAVELEAEPDATLLADLGVALLRRAALPAPDASTVQMIEDAVATLRQAAACAPSDPASPEAWLRQLALQAQAAILPRADAAKLRMEVNALLLAGERAAPEASQAEWYVARVDNELAHAELAQGATRMLHLRTLRTAHQPMLAGPGATPSQLLCWLRVLSAEIAHLRGDAATARFSEGMRVLERLDAACPDDPDVARARAHLLRLRAT